MRNLSVAFKDLMAVFCLIKYLHWVTSCKGRPFVRVNSVCWVSCCMLQTSSILDLFLASIFGNWKTCQKISFWPELSTLAESFSKARIKMHFFWANIHHGWSAVCNYGFKLQRLILVSQLDKFMQVFTIGSHIYFQVDLGNNASSVV